MCRLSELPDNQARGFQVSMAGAAVAILIYRHSDDVYGYRNVCPHRGTTLDWMPDRFMSLEGDYLQCATHGALFEPTSGRCAAGPCKGKGLTPVALTVSDDQVWLAE
ncbi:hypothetical protein CAI21_07405 [Alkalilimnicola ehrlichii]|uniref:Rieske domain-containing protein n=1 Tax=Alkalilimnicola ehrlichii TaxID=351052 RepID=A0A3E0WYQ1_9GAMM|nr:hypothetical protein CAI21_07405 [Alkalilimnicola ehrlichii]RFA37519.1 hypothetical protein CAL65_08740 [Alkalilimnicola ehrlichii]